MLISLAQDLMRSAGKGFGDGVLHLRGVDTAPVVDIVGVIVVVGDRRESSLARGIGGAEVARVGKSVQSNTPTVSIVDVVVVNVVVGDGCGSSLARGIGGVEPSVAASRGVGATCGDSDGGEDGALQPGSVAESAGVAAC